MQVLNGVSASGGVCLGNVLVVSVPDRPGIQKRVVTRAEIDAGWEQFQRARGKVKKSLEALLDSPNQDARDIFKTHLLMLNDEVFISDFHMLYSRSFTNIEYMLNEHVNRFAENLRQSDVTLLAERSADISDVFGKVLDELAGYMGLDVSLVAPSSLVVARFLSPSDMLALAKQGVRGVCLEQGGITSHTAIIARVYGIPAVFGVKNAAKLMETGDFLIIDGIDSRVYLSPDDGTVSKFEHKAAVEAARKKRLEQFRDKPCRTKDGVDIALYANIGTVEEAEIARAENAAGIGLFRTEFLFMQARAALSEDTQLHAYRQVLKIMAGKPVVVRTLDAGGDKIIAAIDEALGGQEGGPAGARSGAKRLRTLYDKNPLLGQRGIRLTLAAPEVFKTQLRALLRAGIYGDLRIMLPLITRPEELTDTLHLIEVAKAELAAASIPYKADVPLGIMVETPATALTAGTFAKNSAFFSLGTNDLTQYTLAVDRENPVVAPFFSEFHPGVLKLIHMTILSAQKQGIPVSVCGEMAGSADGARLLAGMGVRSLSVSPRRITGIKGMFAECTMAGMESFAREMLAGVHGTR